MTKRWLCRWTMLGLLALAIGAGCERLILVGSGIPFDTGLGGGGGTSIISGLGGAGGNPNAGQGGSGGAPFVEPRCASINPTPGTVNPCGRLYSLDFSPDGKLFAAGGERSAPNVHVWRLSDGALVHDFPGLGGTAYDVAFSPDSKLLAVGGVNDGAVLTDSGNGTALIYDVATGALVRQLPTQDGFYTSSVSFSSDGTLLATAGYGMNVEVWRVSDGSLVTRIPYQTSVHNIHFSTGGSQLMVAGTDGVASLWSIPAGRLAYQLSPIAGEMADAEISPDGTQIASTSPDNNVQIWSSAPGHPLVQSLAGHQAYVSQTVWIDQNTLISDDWNGVYIVWKRDSSGQLARASSNSYGAQGLGMAVSPDRKTVAIEAGNGTPGFMFLAF